MSAFGHERLRGIESVALDVSILSKEYKNYVKCKSENNAADLVRRQEAKFRRVAQLCDRRFALRVNGAFVRGGFIAERKHVLTQMSPHWEDCGWEVHDPIQAMWAGERSEEKLCDWSDAPSQVLIRAMLRQTRSMERLLLAGAVPIAEALSLAIEQIYSVGLPPSDVAPGQSVGLDMPCADHVVQLVVSVLESIAHLDQVPNDDGGIQGTLPATSDFSSDADDALALQRSFRACIAALGIEVSSDVPDAVNAERVTAVPVQVTWRFNNAGLFLPAAVQRCIAILQYELEPGKLEVLLKQLPAQDVHPEPLATVTDVAGNSDSIDVYEPRRDSTFYPGEWITVRWFSHPGYTLKQVQIKCCKNPPVSPSFCWWLS